MRSWRVWFPVVWTLAMAVWLVLYRQTEATCGPEIQRDCSIGLSVTAGLGRPGIVLLWGLGLAAFALAWLTDRRARSKAGQPSHSASGQPLLSRLRVVLAVAICAAIAAALPASTRPKREAPPVRAGAVEVQVVSAILHPSASSAGRRRHAARVSVHVRIENQTHRRATFEQPMLLAGGSALPYDVRQYRLRPLQPGAAVDATLRFEPRSAFTQLLVTERDAQLQVAGQLLALTLKIGAPVRKSPLRGVPRAVKVQRAPKRRPPAVARTRPRTRTEPAARPPAPPASPRTSPRPVTPRIPPPPPPPPPPQAAPPRPSSEQPARTPPGTPFDDSG